MLDIFQYIGMRDKSLYINIFCLIFFFIGVFVPGFVFGHFVYLSHNVIFLRVNIIFQNTLITFVFII